MRKQLTSNDILINNGIDKIYIDLFFKLVDQSLEGSLNSKSQHEKFLSLCSKYPNSQRKIFSKIVDILYRNIIFDNDEFDKLHVENGGIMDDADDGFYQDFGCWVIFRGQQILDKFLKNGSEYLIDYIKSLNISDRELTYENFHYGIDNED